jgi:hypothetical protein
MRVFKKSGLFIIVGLIVLFTISYYYNILPLKSLLEIFIIPSIIILLIDLLTYLKFKKNEKNRNF